jgi:hypothetical protein
MNGVFVTRSVVECIDAATKEGVGSTGTKPSICDLQPGQLTLLMLSLLTSAIMLGSKLASFEIVRLKQQEMDRMEAERDTMLQELQEELEASLGTPGEVHEVEKIFAARRHSVNGLPAPVFTPRGKNRLLPAPVPAPAEAADSHLSAGSQVAVCFTKTAVFSSLSRMQSTAASAAGAPGGGTIHGEPGEKCAEFPCGRSTRTVIMKNRRAGRAVP